MLLMVNGPAAKDFPIITHSDIYIYVNKSTTNGTLALLEGNIATNAIHTLFVTELSPKSTTSDGYMDRR